MYGQFGPSIAPARSGVVYMLAAHHASYKREIILQYGALLGRMLENESAMYLDLRARGYKFYMAGDAISYHVNISNLADYCRIDYLGQRGFASARAEVGKWSRARRRIYATATPLVPFMRLSRSVRDIFRTGRAKQLLPQILVPMSVALLRGMVGEMLGYLVRPSRENFVERTEIELNRSAFLTEDDRAEMRTT